MYKTDKSLDWWIFFQVSAVEKGCFIDKNIVFLLFGLIIRCLIVNYELEIEITDEKNISCLNNMRVGEFSKFVRS